MWFKGFFSKIKKIVSRPFQPKESHVSLIRRKRVEKPTFKSRLLSFRAIFLARARRFLEWIRKMSFVRYILFFYLIITIVGSLLLFSPSARKVDVSYVDALFTAASAFSDTGLSTVSLVNTWTVFGQAVISILILVGGFGWFALKIYFFNILFNRPISALSLEALSAERGGSKVGFSKRIVKVSVSILFITLFIGSFILTLMFYFSSPNSNPYNLTSPIDNNTPTDNIYYTKTLKGYNDLTGSNMVLENPQGDFLVALRYGIFHTISAMNNAGADIIGNNSIAPYYHDYGVQIMFILLFVFGGIGYPVIYDAYNYLVAKIKRRPFRWSLFTKISTVTYFVVALIGIVVTFIIETSIRNTAVYPTDRLVSQTTSNIEYTKYTFWNNPMYGTKGEKSMAIIFNSLSTRNAGFATVRMGDFSSGTIWVFSILMIIGAAPSSTGGGVRTTTIAIIAIALYRRIRGDRNVYAFKRTVPPETVNRATVVLFVGIVIWAIGALFGTTSLSAADGLANISNNVYSEYIFTRSGERFFNTRDFTAGDFAFESASAFGTTGLTIGVTPLLSSLSKVVLIFIMFIGQLGISSTIFVLNKQASKSKYYKFVEEDINIG